MTNLYRNTWKETRQMYYRNFGKEAERRNRGSLRSSTRRQAWQYASSIIDKQFKEKVALGTIHRTSQAMAATQIAGRTGTVLRFVGRSGVRAVPIIGYAMLAKDAYDIYRWATK